MRLVDIFFKDINGQLSEAKGSLNVVGHLMMYHSKNTNSNYFKGYFEIDGSLIKNAHINYSELYRALGDDGVSPEIKLAQTVGNDIQLNSKSALIGVKSASGGISGLYHQQETQDHNHQYHFAYVQGELVPTQKTATLAQQAFYSMRFFIYHGVH